jgi:hypothetical protein
MGEVARPGAAGAAESERNPAVISQALEWLRTRRGHVFMFGHDAKGYWAARPKAGSGVLRADSPEDLDKLCAAALEAGPS